MEFSFSDKKDWIRNYLDDILTKGIKDVTELSKLDAMRSAVTWLLAHSSQLFIIDEFCSKTALTLETAQTYISALSSLYLFDKIPARTKSDYEKIGKRSTYIATDTSLIATTLGWSEDAALFDDKINGKLAEAWKYHEISAQTDIDWNYKISHYRDIDKREVNFIIEDDVGRTAGIEVKCDSVVGQSNF